MSHKIHNLKKTWAELQNLESAQWDAFDRAADDADRKILDAPESDEAYWGAHRRVQARMASIEALRHAALVVRDAIDAERAAEAAADSTK